jgi:Xaa-Pro aminopeptidase
VKHEEEIGVMRELASLLDWVQERYRENIRPGRVATELDMSMSALMAEEAARRMPGTDLEIAGNCVTVSGPVSSAPHGVSASGSLAGSTIDKGHVLIVSLSPAIDGLYVENERTFFCGPPSKRQAQLFEAMRVAQSAACEAVITGRPICSIDETALAQFERAGVDDLVLHRTGHGLGLGDHDFPIDMSFNTHPLLERMVFSVEPALFEFGLGGFRHCDSVVAGARPQVLTSTSKDLKSQTIL